MSTSPFQILKRCLAVSLTVWLAVTSVWAQSYPEKTITLVVPFAAGSGTDAVARQVAQKLSERLKQAVVVDNRAGANAQIGVEYAAKANPDGYTLLLTTATSHSANPYLYKSLRYDPLKDFTPVARLGIMPFVMVVKPSLPVRNMAEFVSYAKQNPGKLAFASPNGTSMLASEALAKMAQLDLINVAYKSAPQAMTDLMAGHLDFYVVDFTLALPQIRAGKVRPLGLANNRNSQLLPDVPPLAQTIPGFDLHAWNGIFGPANMPKAVAERLSQEIQAVMADPETQSKLSGIGFDIQPTRSPDEFKNYVTDQLADWGRMIKVARIQPE
ncbi:PBP2_Bug_TTT domain containing protein [Burkholderiaceae bacterium]